MNSEYFETLKEKQKLEEELNSITESIENFSEERQAARASKRTENIKFAIKEFIRQIGGILLKVAKLSGNLFTSSNGRIVFNGNVPAIAFTAENAESVAERQKATINACLRDMARGGINRAAAAKLGQALQTLYSIFDSADSFTSFYMEKENAESAEKKVALERERESILIKIKEAEEKLKGLLKARFDKTGKELERGLSVRIRLDEDSNERANSLPIGFLKGAFTQKDKRIAEELGYDLSALSLEPVNLCAEENNGTLFVELDDGYASAKGEIGGDKLYDIFVRILLGGITEFAPHNLKLTFIDVLRNSKGNLDLIYNYIKKNIAVDLVYENGVAHNFKDANARLSMIKSEMDERNYIISSDGCLNINEYNERNIDNKLPYIVLVVNGYPESIDEEGFDLLREILSNNARYGILVLIVGHNRAIQTRGFGREETLFLNLNEYGINELKISADGTAEYNGKSFDVISLAGDLLQRNAEGRFNYLCWLSEFENRMKDKEKFWLEKIVESEHNDSAYERISIPIGNCDGKTFYYATSTESRPYPFSMITGSTGSGKSAFLHMFIMSAAMKYSPEEVEFHIIDFKSSEKSVEFGDYEFGKELYIPHIKYLSLKARPENALEVVKYVKDLMVKRNRIGKFLDYNTSEDVKSGKKKPLPMIYVIIDEYNEMLRGGEGNTGDDAYEITSKIKTGLTSILQRARIYGIGVIFSGQTLSNALHKDAVDQINTRIAFYNEKGFEDLFGDKWKQSYQDKFPKLLDDNGKPIPEPGYAFSAPNGQTEPSFIKTAYCGTPTKDKGKIRSMAERIRQKYAEYITKQVVVGKECGVPIDRTDMYRTWKEEVDYIIGSASVDESENIDEIRENFSGMRKLAIGISGTGLQEEGLEYSYDKDNCGYFACANTNNIAKIERNAAYAFIWQTASVGLQYKTPRVIYCDTERESGFDGCFGQIGQDRKIVDKCIEHVCGEMNIAKKIMQLSRQTGNRDKTTEPYLVIVHEASWLQWRRKPEWWTDKPKSNEQSSNDNVRAEESFSNKDIIKLDKMKEAMASGKIKISAEVLQNLTSLKSDAVSKTVNEDRMDFTFEEFKKAFASLYTEGNRCGIFILATTESYGTISETFLALAQNPDDRNKINRFAVYGSFEEKKNKQVSKFGVDSCYVCPAMTGLRLFDYNADCAEIWWEQLKNKLNGEIL